MVLFSLHTQASVMANHSSAFILVTLLLALKDPGTQDPLVTFLSSYVLSWGDPGGSFAVEHPFSLFPFVRFPSFFKEAA